MKKTLIALTFALLASHSQAATVLGLELGAAAWQTTLDSPDDNTLKTDKDTSGVAWLAFEHPLPVLPNIRLSHNAMRHDVRQSLAGSGELDSSFTDATLYYEVLDNWLSLDLGITGRRYQGESVSGNEDIDSSLGLLYAGARFALPLTGLAIGVEINYDDIGLNGGESVRDGQLFLQYKTGFGFGVMAGYRDNRSDIRVGKTIRELALDGGFAGLFWRF